MKIIPLALLALCTTSFSLAQTADKEKKEETITIRKKTEGNSKEKMTVVVDGDNITVNGKPLSEMKDADIEILHNHIGSPKVRAMVAPKGGMKMSGDVFVMAGNKAFLGVVSEKNEKGAKITSIEKESAAEKAGLQKEDIITKVADTKITGSEDLYEAIGKYKPEDKITITYLRNGKEATATATLGKSKSPQVRTFNMNGNDDFHFEMPDMPEMNGFKFNGIRKPRLGIEIQDLAEGKGVKILDVDGDTPAEKSGLKKDDIISEIDGKPIASVDELKAKLKDLKEGDSIKVTYQRNGKTQTADIKFPKRLKTANL
jgi:serine protease Do